MARIRTIKPEFPHSESMGRVSREARLCFILLWTVADDVGRLRGNSRMLASLLYPYDDDAKNRIDGWLKQLSSEGCIARYEVAGTSYIEICNWLSHQKIDKPSASKLPAFDESSRIIENPREQSAMDLDLGMDLGMEKESSAEPQSDSPQVASLPLVDGSEFPVTKAAVDEWVKAFPAVDVLQQLQQMRVWCNANKSNRKTSRGINAFVVRWLSKAQNSAPVQRPTARPMTASDREAQDMANPRQQWALDAGFANVFEARNDGCHERNAHQFRDGKRIEVAA